MTQRLFSLGWAVALFSLTTIFAQAETKLPNILGSHMVLQQGAECPIWGWDEPGAMVTVTFAGQSHNAKAGKEGRWQVNLSAMKANPKGRALTVKGTSTVKLTDVLVGEVWLCSGQSNMEWTVTRSMNAKEEIAAAKHPLIRHIKVPHTLAQTPQSNVATSGWQPTTPKVAGNFTAVGYYFARHLQGKLNVPIGLIGSNWGGTRIEPWTPPVGFKGVPALKASHADKLGDFAKAKPGRSTPTHMYNAMIHPLQPYAFRGALWYQGESNRADGLKYQAKMRALIQGWRTVWNNSDMPFYFVQLAPFRYGGDPKLLPAIWQAQLNTLKLPHTGMAVTTDITTLGDIHPPNKQDVGKRLALWALAKTYSQKGFTYSGPLFEKVDQAEGEGSLTVWFKKATTGGLKTSNGKPVSHFEIADKDGKWHPAEATIVYGDHLIVSSKAVKQPKHVRFGWDQLATPNLINGAGLPASPFTATVGKKH